MNYLRVLLDYCFAITREPRAGSANGVQRLRKAGWSDEAIHDALQVTGFFNYYDGWRTASASNPNQTGLLRGNARDGQLTVRGTRAGYGVAARSAPP